MLILHKPNSRAKCYIPATPGAAFRGTPAPDCLLPSEANGWGVSEIIAQYVLATFTPDKILAMGNGPGVVLLVAEAQGNLAGYIVTRFGSYHAGVSVEIEGLYIKTLCLVVQLDRHC